MRQIDTRRRDPAPSRLAYRVQRLLLTPLFHSLMRVGLPAFALAFGAGFYLSDEDRRANLGAEFAELRRQIEERPEFAVSLMAIEGASAELAEDIREIEPIDFPVSSFDLDLAAMRERIRGLDAVARASLRIRPGGVLEVSILEREPAVVWRSGDSLELLDAGGHRVAAIAARKARADLPLIAGQGADRAVPEALALIAAAAPVAGRMRGLVRVGLRRWDLVLDRGQVIMLPETQPVAALEQVLARDQAQDLLARDVAAVDMRYPRRPTLRLSAPAVAVLERIRALENGAN